MMVQEAPSRSPVIGVPVRFAMNSRNRNSLFLIALCLSAALPGAASTTNRVKVANGLIEATAQPASGVRSFKGIPFAQPPVGDLRWREPQPVKNWKGVRKADQFGPRCMQRTSPGADYWFRSNGMSEDCLYLNVWTPAKSDKEKLPVLVYIFGGGFQNGDGSEPRYDGESMARKGMVAVSGQLPDQHFRLLRPSGTDQGVAAPRRGQLRAARPGGRPAVGAEEHRGVRRRPRSASPIAGESAGSISVSALMASPLSKDLMAGAIGESGAMISSLPPQPLADAEQNGAKFGAAAGANTLAALRAMTAEQIQEAAAKSPGSPFRHGTLDGYFLPKPLTAIFEAGEQAKIPLLAGSNTQEQAARSVLGDGEPTPETLANAIQKFYGDKADGILKAYAATTPDEVYEAATHLASARFIAHSTWKWTELQMKTGGKPVYRYLYARPRPAYLGCRATRPGSRAGRGPAAASGPRWRVAFRRDPVRHGQPRSGQALLLGARRLRGLQSDAGLLCELHQDRQSEWSRPPGVAGVPRRQQLPAHADRRGLARRAGAAPRPLPGAGCDLRQTVRGHADHCQPPPRALYS